MTAVAYAFCDAAFYSAHLQPLVDEKLVRISILNSLVQALSVPHGVPLIVDDSLLSPAAPERRALFRRAHLVLVGDFDLASAIQLCGTSPVLAHVLWRNDRLLGRQLRSTLLQLLGAGAWDVKDYLRAGTAITKCVLTSSDKQGAIIEQVSAAAAAAGGFSELSSSVATVASELMMNAIFNAPLDGNTGAAKYRESPRDAVLQLTPGEAVTLSYGADEALFGLSVRDQFGRFNRQTLLEYLVRSGRADDAQIKMRTPGAGVGLYMVINAVSQLDIHVVTGRTTQIVALFGLSKRFRDYESFGHSLNFFVREPAV